MKENRFMNFKENLREIEVNVLHEKNIKELVLNKIVNSNGVKMKEFDLITGDMVKCTYRNTQETVDGKYRYKLKNIEILDTNQETVGNT